MFSAYGDFTRLPLHINEGCHRVNVRCIVVPKGCSVYGAILVEMFLFALDRHQPAYIMMISGVSEPLRYAGSFVWDWPSLAKTSRSYSYSNSLNEVSLPHVSSNERNDSMRVQPGEKNDSMRVQPHDVKGLKRNLVPPLKSSGGQLPLDEIESEGRIYNLRKRKT
nr:hypothetical protein [Tanacetum cinerariifolium]